MKFLLMVLFVAADGATPIHFQPFDTQAGCEKVRAQAIRQVPRNPELSFVAICAPVRNATQVEV